MDTLTAKGSLDHWTHQLDELFNRFSTASEDGGWSADRGKTEILEEPYGLGVPLSYEAPVLVLRRPSPRDRSEQRITFEPQARFVIGAAGRVDVYSYPQFREVMLLRVVDRGSIPPAEEMTPEAAEILAASAPWKAFSQERLPLQMDLSDDAGFLAFLEDLVAHVGPGPA
ncbi:MAG TPA: hypothetical protein VGN26_22030 [Armatimonadota bacterium]|jgi:hypothetical protein